jgi:phosphoglycerate kinase
MPFRTLDQAGDLSGRRVLVRVDFNVPMAGGRVADDSRLRAAAPTIRYLSERGAKVVLIAHFDRPKGQRVPRMSLSPIVQPLAELLEMPVAFSTDCVGAETEADVAALSDGGVILLENLRYHAGEEADDPAFVGRLARLGDLYVDDAFSAAHRAHASTEGVARRLPAYAGLAMQAELEHLDRALGHPARPVMGIVGGSKISTKIDLLKNLVTRLDSLAIGGGMANTFLFAQGCEIGESICERDLAGTARQILALAHANGWEVLLPVDAVVGRELVPGGQQTTRRLAHIQSGDRIFDIGHLTVARLEAAMDTARTLVWNGPLGVFEVPPFDISTVAVARHAAALVQAGRLVAVAGGGDTMAALKHAGVANGFSFVSTAGGAFLEWMEGKPLPGVAVLEGGPTRWRRAQATSGVVEGLDGAPVADQHGVGHHPKGALVEVADPGGDQLGETGVDAGIFPGDAPRRRGLGARRDQGVAAARQQHPFARAGPGRDIPGLPAQLAEVEVGVDSGARGCLQRQFGGDRRLLVGRERQHRRADEHRLGAKQGQDRQGVDPRVEYAHPAGVPQPLLAGMPLAGVLLPGDGRLGDPARRQPEARGFDRGGEAGMPGREHGHARRGGKRPQLLDLAQGGAGRLFQQHVRGASAEACRRRRPGSPDAPPASRPCRRSNRGPVGARADRPPRPGRRPGSTSGRAGAGPGRSCPGR